MSTKCQNLPKNSKELLRDVLGVYEYEDQNDSEWIPGNVEADFKWRNEAFSVFFTNEGYGFRGGLPPDITRREAIIATIIVFELSGVDYDLPKGLSNHRRDVTV